MPAMPVQQKAPPSWPEGRPVDAKKRITPLTGQRRLRQLIPVLPTTANRIAGDFHCAPAKPNLKGVCYLLGMTTQSPVVWTVTSAFDSLGCEPPLGLKSAVTS